MTGPTEPAAAPEAVDAEPADEAVAVPEPVAAPVPRILPPWRTAVLLGVLVAIGFVVRIDALRNSALDVPTLGDAKAYEMTGWFLAEDHVLVRPYEYGDGAGAFPTAEYPPATATFVAVAKVAHVDGATGIRTLLCAVGALTVGLVGLSGRRLGGDGAGYLAAGIAAAYPALWNTDVTLMAEPLAAFAGAALVLGALAVADRPTWWRWVAFGALAGLACFVRSEFLLIGPLLAAVVALKAVDGWGARAGRLAVAVGMVLLVLAPWTARNFARFHELVPLSNNSGSVAKGANCDAAYRGQYKGLWVTNVALGGTEGDPARAGCFEGFGIGYGTPNEAQVAARLRREGLSYARHHAGELPGVMAARVGRTVGLYRFDQQSNFAYAEGRNPTWERRGTRGFQLLFLIGIVGLVAAAARRRLEWRRTLLLVAPACVLVVVALTYGNPRFRAAAEPSVVVLATLALVDAATARRTAQAEGGPGGDGG
ncbi:MAG: glycosyltransferase family 39 protein [Acidimicrobiales bacterium]